MRIVPKVMRNPMKNTMPTFRGDNAISWFGDPKRPHDHLLVIYAESPTLKKEIRAFADFTRWYLANYGGPRQDLSGKELRHLHKRLWDAGSLFSLEFCGR